MAGVSGCVTSSGSGSGGGRFVEAFDPTGSALAAAFGRPTPESEVQSALASHVRTSAFLEQYPATRQKAGCPASGSCTHRLVLVHVDGRGKPIGEQPSCGEISAQLDRTGQGQVSVRDVNWTRRSGACGG
jgi:hypothetical protein